MKIKIISFLHYLSQYHFNNFCIQVVQFFTSDYWTPKAPLSGQYLYVFTDLKATILKNLLYPWSIKKCTQKSQ